MATKKKTVQKTAKKPAAKRKPVVKKAVKKAVPRKSVAKKVVAKKKVLKKKVAPKRAQRKLTDKTAIKKPRKRAASSTARKKRILTPKTPLPIKRSISIKRIWYTVTFPVLVVIMAVGGFLAKNPDGIDQLQANLFSAFSPASISEERETLGAPQEIGFVLMRSKEDTNAKKLEEVFMTIFNNLQFTPILHDSAQGKRLIEEYKPSEIPTVLIPKQTFEKQDMVNIVSELFSFSEGYYVLNASVVNPDNQLLLGQVNSYPSSMNFINKSPQYALQLFTDVKNIEARAHEKNILGALEEWIKSGILSLQIIDVPQGPESEFAAYAFACLAQVAPDEYLEFRKDVISIAKNTTQSYIDRKLKRLIGNYSEKCDQKEVVAQLKSQAKTAQGSDGVTSVPSLLIQRGQSPYRTRFTGNKSIGDYELGLEQTEVSEEVL
ncbi:MAG: thioredoxin domain-containing protein [Candidatus Gracilibacteria bacterium]|nr:thioredoxin domain-containing protein [Candidatus Gracilibacteria bacterium]